MTYQNDKMKKLVAFDAFYHRYNIHWTGNQSLEFIFFYFSVQFIATIVKNLLIVDLGLIGAFPVILIASMTGNSNEHNRNEILSITPVQATWLGKSDHILPSNLKKKNSLYVFYIKFLTFVTHGIARGTASSLSLQKFQVW